MSWLFLAIGFALIRKNRGEINVSRTIEGDYMMPPGMGKPPRKFGCGL